MENKQFSTSVVNLNILQSICFSIPTYQRPFVWGDEQIIKLLSDFYKSFRHDRAANYYIGTILTKEGKNEAELIDGQQRFTTIWLTAFVFSRKIKNSQLEKFLRNDDQTLKMSFEIRTEVEDYFKQLLDKDKNEDIKLIQSSEIAKFPYLINIAKALATINGYIDSIPENELSDFGDFIYQKVHFIKNTTPPKIDLNKLFSTINSAGVQLEQTDILKSNLLNRIDDKVLYSKIWESCENMNNFFERNVRDSFPKTYWSIIDLSNFTEFDPNKFLYEILEIIDDKSVEIFTIDNFVSENIETYNPDKKQTEDEKRESDEIFCRSIINFGQLLLHTYRLHLKKEGLEDFEGTFHVNRLIEIFKPLETRNNPEEIKRFFLLLWKVRYIFDKYIIKWISDVETKTEYLELVNVSSRNAEYYYSRTKYAKSSMLMLQSVLYFTGDYFRQFWLTSYLGYLLNNHNNADAKSEILLNKLEQIDNDLSLCNNLTDKEASYKLLDSKINVDFNILSYLNETNGTKFKHYWFQKIEYILWKNWDTTLKTNEFENYRIVSRNSVEHIYPQKPQNPIKNPKIDDEYLHCFGNLVLLSVSQNSEYSNKSVDEKRSMFRNKNNTYDSLKSYYIFQKFSEWTYIEIMQHRDEMIEKIKDHYSLK